MTLRGMELQTALIDRCVAYQRRAGISATTASTRLFDNPSTLPRLIEGKGCTLAKYEEAMRRLDEFDAAPTADGEAA